MVAMCQGSKPAGAGSGRAVKEDAVFRDMFAKQGPRVMESRDPELS